MSQSICVYCASSSDLEPVFYQHARSVGRMIGQRGQTLVYGGGTVGLMGELARAVHANGGRVVGVIPSIMSSLEIAYQDADELIVVETMRQRKDLMDRRADAFVVLPGGFGTLEELCEIITLRLLKFHDRPIIIINTHGFYDPLMTLFDHLICHNFAKPKHRDLFTFVDSPEAAFDLLASDLDSRA